MRRVLQREARQRLPGLALQLDANRTARSSRIVQDQLPPLETDRCRYQLTARITRVRRGKSVKAQRRADQVGAVEPVVLADVDRQLVLGPS